ncbi:MAG: GNAT family N-acetyltransferase [Pseudomonadota bacterium]
MSLQTVVRPLGEGDLSWVLQLNQIHQQDLSSLTSDQLAALASAATIAWVAAPDLGFMLAFDQDAPYDGVNFQWFRSRYDQFIYVDRIAVDEKARGRGVARQLYSDLFVHAGEAGYSLIAAEINSDPPNPGSDAFHERLGFETVGETDLADRGKTVRYVARQLD